MFVVKKLTVTCRPLTTATQQHGAAWSVATVTEQTAAYCENRDDTRSNDNVKGQAEFDVDVIGLQEMVRLVEQCQLVSDNVAENVDRNAGTNYTT